MIIRRGAGSTYLGVLVLAIVLSSLVTLALAVRYLQPSSDAQQNQALINSLVSQNADLQRKIDSISTHPNITLLGLDPVKIYQSAAVSVVTVQGVQVGATSNSTILGSGFVTEFQGAFYIVTNFHVVQNVTDQTVTFSDGDAYRAKVVGIDPYSDLAVLTTNASSVEFHPLQIVGSSQLRVGEPVIAIGNPFGLSGSMTFGILSQLGRTIFESLAGNFPIADVIQFSAPINPGNSGGPLLNANGTVIGMTTAIVESSQGVGFAIPSDTILRELPFLVTTGRYDLHPLVGIQTVDMNYQLALLQGTNVTYGVLVEGVTSGGPADSAGLRAGSQTVSLQGSQYTIGGDIIVGINGTKIVNRDALSAYLEESALPGQTIVIQIIRNGSLMTLNLTLGTRPPAPAG